MKFVNQKDETEHETREYSSESIVLETILSEHTLREQEHDT